MRDYSKSEVLEILGLPTDVEGVVVEVDWDGYDFRDSDCHIDKLLPAAVHVDYYDVDADPEVDVYEPGTLHQVAFSLQHAATGITEILGEAFQGDDDYGVQVVVNGWALTYGMGQVAA
ncbi:hypothetical protein IU449_26900 [Nocardia higoensis]|uniref:Uncharacterized protein n=1 Tax=Nocardia higoensis TaxID=228599 RepID=A0ABS0DI81_9NOCA|nr:hypothetical protein [Nocardia higoensis]MBF6358129.1 hypothetical protein [Nocardia higoensis]